MRLAQCLCEEMVVGDVARLLRIQELEGLAQKYQQHKNLGCCLSYYIGGSYIGAYIRIYIRLRVKELNCSDYVGKSVFITIHTHFWN